MYWIARGFLRTCLRSERRRKVREAKKAANAVTHDEEAAPPSCEDHDERLLCDVAARLAHTDTERAVLALWLRGVNSPPDVARELGFGTDADAVRRARVLLDRLRQRIHRERIRQQQAASGTGDVP